MVDNQHQLLPHDQRDDHRVTVAAAGVVIFEPDQHTPQVFLGDTVDNAYRAAYSYLIDLDDEPNHHAHPDTLSSAHIREFVDTLPTIDSWRVFSFSGFVRSPAVGSAPPATATVALGISLAAQSVRAEAR